MGKEILTDEQIALQKKIDYISGEISKIQKLIEDEKKAVTADQTKIDEYIAQLKELNANFNNVTNTHQSAYDSMKGQITMIKADIERCYNKTKPTVLTDKSIVLNTELEKQGSLSKLKKEISDLIAQIEPYDSKIIIYKGDIILFQRQIKALEISINSLKSIQDTNKKKIDVLNDIITGLNRQIIELEEIDDSNQIYNNQNILNLGKSIDASLNILFSHLDKPSLHSMSNIFHDKISNRDIDHEKLNNSNKAFDVIFYCFYFAFILIMICTQNIKREHFLIYLFVGLIPFIYPFLFKLIVYLIKYLYNDIHGPKNAFVDINNTLIAYNN